VLYPAIDFSKFNGERQASLFDRPYFVSLNRYERKKDIKLAIEAFALLPKRLIEENYLVIAGGFDDRVAENVEHYKELQDTALAKGIAGSVRFMRNITDGERVNLLTNSVAVLYTPENEHFGIVPCEAMYSGVPVIAANCGGPMESVADGSSGFLVEGGAGNA
jgi:alpha-1,3/alpha-1,6-mannosyltransferase